MKKVFAVLVIMVNTSVLCVDKRIVDGALAVGRAFFPAVLMGGLNWRQQQKAALLQKKMVVVSISNARQLNIGHGEHVSFLQPNTPSTR